VSPRRNLVATLMGLTLSAAPALADEPDICPSQGESTDQMDRDKYDCYNWHSWKEVKILAATGVEVDRTDGRDAFLFRVGAGSK